MTCLVLFWPGVERELESLLTSIPFSFQNHQIHVKFRELSKWILFLNQIIQFISLFTVTINCEYGNDDKAQLKLFMKLAIKLYKRTLYENETRNSQ